jgi:ACR3 family arsenite efflux pump ArsB
LERETLEKYQVFIYLAAIVCGLLVGTVLPSQVGVLERGLWPALALLLYATFTQVPLAHLHEAFRDARFIASTVIGNFILLPFVVWGPDEIARGRYRHFHECHGWGDVSGPITRCCNILFIKSYSCRALYSW